MSISIHPFLGETGSHVTCSSSIMSTHISKCVCACACVCVKSVGSYGPILIIFKRRRHAAIMQTHVKRRDAENCIGTSCTVVAIWFEGPQGKGVHKVYYFYPPQIIINLSSVCVFVCVHTYTYNYIIIYIHIVYIHTVVIIVHRERCIVCTLIHISLSVLL